MVVISVEFINDVLTSKTSTAETGKWGGDGHKKKA